MKLAAFFIFALLPAAIFPCGVCASKGFSQSLADSYIAITILLSGLPLVFGGLLIAYMVKRSKSDQ